VLLAVNTGVLLFLIGLISESAILKRIGTPIMGLALLWAIATYWQGLGQSQPATA
jgi:Zn-dependent membrane protease YugP